MAIIYLHNYILLIWIIKKKCYKLQYAVKGILSTSKGIINQAQLQCSYHLRWEIGDSLFISTEMNGAYMPAVHKTLYYVLGVKCFCYVSVILNPALF